MNITKRVMDYIKEKGLSVDELTKATGIAKERFCSDQTVFSADEFMRICCYLQEDPYLFSIEDNAERIGIPKNPSIRIK